MPISMSSPSASIVATPVGADCSSSASCSTRSLPHPLDIGLHALALKHKTTTSSGHSTQAATPLSYFQRTLHLSRSLGAGTQAHVGASDTGIGYPEIGVVESVEHLDGYLQAEPFLEGEPLLDRKILVHVFGRPQIGKVTRSSAERVVSRRFKSCRVEEAVFRSHRDGGNP